MITELNDLKVQLEKVTYDNKESAITMDSLREANIELTNELDTLKVTIDLHVTFRYHRCYLRIAKHIYIL